MSNIKTMTSAFAIAALGLLGACSPSVAWTDYSYKPQHFAAAFTAPPKVTAGEQPFLVEQNDGEVDFGVTAACNIVTNKNPDQMMADAIEGTRLNGTVRNVVYTALGGTMGREMLVDRTGGPTIKQRLFVHGGCLYLIFAGTKDGADDERVAHFLDSFRFL